MPSDVITPKLANAPHAAATSSRRQVLIFSFVFLMYVLNSADRAALSIALPALSVEFSLSPVELGWISSAFLWSYFLLNIPGGVLVDLKGPRKVGSIAVALWSLAMVLGSAAQTVGQFIATRVLLGVGESPTFPLGGRILRDRAPLQHRATVSTMLLAGMHAGVGLGTIGGAYLIALYGWRFEFAALGVIGLCWAVGWYFVYPKDDHHAPVKGEAAALRPAAAARLFRSPTFLSIQATMCLGNFSNFLLASWMPVYVIKELKVSLTDAGLFSGAAYCSGALSAIVLARLSERLLFRGSDNPAGRRFVIAAFATVAAVSLISLPQLTGLWPVVALSTTVAFMGAASGANLALLADMLADARKLGSITGVMLTISNLIGILAPVLTGYILAITGSFDAAWYLGASGLIVAAIMAVLLVRKPIEMAG